MHHSKSSAGGTIGVIHVGPYSILFLFVFLSSCVSSDYLILEDGPVECGWNNTSIEFLQEAPNRPFIKVAVVESTKLWWAYASWEDLRQGICQEAVTVGADAIIEVTSAKSRYDATFGFVGTSGDTKQLRGIAIRYKNETPSEN